MATAQAQKKTNFDWLIETVETFRYSQGFYSRIARDLNEMSEEERKQVKEEYNNLDEKFNSVLDVVYFLEC
jgi:hypothetical protein